MHFLIIGVGSIGERHLRSFLGVPGARCSFAEVTDSTRQKVADAYAAEAVYADYREADLSTFDGVVICVPANLHVPIACDVIRAGTHVLTEKPLSTSLEGVDELKRLRDEQGVVVSVAFTMRSHPMFREMKKRVDGGDLGTVRAVNYYAGQWWPVMRKDYPPKYAQSRATGGGVIPDHMVHQVNMLQWMFGRPEKVSAGHWRLGLDDIATEDTGQILLQYPGGQVARLGVCLCQHGDNMMLQVIGERGTLRITDNMDTLDHFDGAAGQWTQSDPCAGQRDAIFRLQTEHFIDCIERRDTPRCTVEEAEDTLRTILAALASADGDGRYVSV